MAHPPDENRLSHYRDILTKYQHLSAVALSPIIGVSFNTINYYRKVLNLPWTATVPCACGCGKAFVAKGCQKYAPECGIRIAKERRIELKKERSYRGPIHTARRPEHGKMIPCLACGHAFLSTNKAHRICDTCKAYPEWACAGIHQHGFGRIGPRTVGGAA